MKTIFFIAIGGAVGSVLRYLISRIFTTSFPLGTLVVNVIGCLLIGFFYGIFANRGCHLSSEVRAMLTVGLCGGFTTFSTFINDSCKLVSLDQYLQAGLYLSSSIILGFFALYLGQKTSLFV